MTTRPPGLTILFGVTAAPDLRVDKPGVRAPRDAFPGVVLVDRLLAGRELA